MKKFGLFLSLAFILICGWPGYSGIGTAPANAAPPPPPVYTCDPYYPYRCYYTAPYADPYTQYFYYVVPDVEERLREREERLERRERQQRRREWEEQHGFR
ncbi:MAG: hypothetical protein M1438_06435 [Deltaproteobacteria bacterium]|nr:hypothetical protein [Deltaproteobacteria bacterium]